MDESLELPQTLDNRLRTIRECSIETLESILSNLSLTNRLPAAYLSQLDEVDLTICFRATLLCYFVTLGTQVPREMQLKAIVADQKGEDSLIAAVVSKPGDGAHEVVRYLDDDIQSLLQTLGSTNDSRLILSNIIITRLCMDRCRRDSIERQGRQRCS